MRTTKDYGTMYEQALQILHGIGLNPSQATEGSTLYKFEYKGIPMFLDDGDDRNDFVLLCPLLLDDDAENAQRTFLDEAHNIAEDDLKEFYIYYVCKDLAYISQFLSVKKSRNKLYKKHLLQKCDEMVEGYNTILTSMAIRKFLESPEFLETISDN